MNQFILGILLIIFTSLYDRNILRVDFKAIGYFLIGMFLITMSKIFIYDFLFDVYGYFPYKMAYIANKIAGWDLGLVFWEDAFYVIPIFLLIKVFKKWYLYMPLVVLLSIDFALGHQYQGNHAVFITALYPFFISYHFGKKYGLGTVMICHVVFDFIAVYTMINLRHFIGL